MSQLATRHRAREIALQILYRLDEVKLSNPSDIARELSTHFEHFQVADEIRDFVAQMVSGAFLNRDKTDELITGHSANWRLDRMGAVDRNILRLSVYELIHEQLTPPKVVIDEAIELARSFGNADSPAFVNGILDAILKTKP